jgi:hypothetical protein
VEACFKDDCYFSIDKVTRLRAIRLIHLCSTHGGERDFSRFQNIHTGPEVQPSSYSMGTGVHILGDNAAWQEVDYPPQSAAEIKNVWSYTCISLMHHCHDASLSRHFVLFIFRWLSWAPSSLYLRK